MKKKLRLGKKASFEVINEGMIAFISFVLITLLVILLVGTVKTEMSLVCKAERGSNASVVMDTGTCAMCVANVSSGALWTYNSTGNNCYEVGNEINERTYEDFNGSAYVATVRLEEAAGLPPQFAQIIVIIVVIVGILGMLAFIGYGAYERLKR